MVGVKSKQGKQEELEALCDQLVEQNKGVNFLTDYVEYAKNLTDCPLPFHDYLALLTAGTVINRNRYFQFGHTKIYPNFYLIVIAPSSLYRKSTALSISRDAIYSINPTRVFPSDFSQEKIMEVLKETPSGVFYFYEWKSLMGLLSKDYMTGCKSFLTELYDCYSMSVARKGISFTVESPCVSIASATTSDWFIDNLKSGDIGGGFLARFIFVYSKVKLRNDALPAEPDQMLRAVMKQDLQALAELTEEKMILSPEAEKDYKHWYNKFSTKYESLPVSFRTLFARLTIYCIKIAMVVETCETKKTEISSGSMQQAIHYSDWLQASATELCHGELSFSKHEGWEKRIIRILKEKGKNSRSQLLWQSHLSSREFGGVVETLLEKELIKVGHERVDGSQKQTVFYELLAGK